MAGLVVVAAWLLVVGAGSAWATTGHEFAGEFGGAGSGDGQFAEPLNNGPSAVAVMPSTGEVFAVDEGRVQRFIEAGVFSSSFALDPSFQGGVSSAAADPTGLGAIYVATGENGGVPSVVKYSTAGVQAYALDTSGSGVSINGNAHIAVDPADGTVYVTATRESDGMPVVASFDQAGVFVGSFDGSDGSLDGGFAQFCLALDGRFLAGHPSNLAVDSSHRVYVLDPCKNNGTGRVDQFSATGTWAATISNNSPSAVATDPVSDEVYVAQPGPVGLQIAHLTPGGTAPIYTFNASNVNGVRVMAVSGIGTVYTSDATDPVVERFVRFEGPTLTTDPADPINARDATLNGTIDPEGVESTYHFEYGLDESYGSRTPESDSVTGSDPVAASGLATGLRPSTTYHFRIVGTNSSGSIDGPDLEFTTGPAPARLDGSPPFASVITPRTARVHGTINPNSNGFVGWRFEYGTTTAYGSTADTTPLGICFGAGCGGDDMPVVAQLSNLEPGTLYHFRLVASPDGLFGTQNGVDQTFITAPAAGGGASDVTTKRATLTGTVNPHGQDTTYHFNYGPTTAYGASTPEVNAGSGDGDQQVSHEISGLTPDTTYHVQVVATSADGVIRYGGDGLFRTAPAATTVAIGPTGVTTNAATLGGDVNTFGLTGSYRFDVWSLNSAYATSTTERPVAGNATAERVTAGLSGLPAGETFVVQLTVTSNDSSSVSDLLTFATPEVPKVFPPPPASDPTSIYGCAAPQLDAYNKQPKPGETITITGHDLGISGNATLASYPLEPSAWSATGFKLVVPEDASGPLALTANCGRQSNTITVAVFQEPDNRFTIPSRSIAGSTATLQVRVPGPGKLESTGTGIRAAGVTVKKAGTATLKIRLTNTATKALSRSKSHTRTVKARLRYTPAGGQPATKTVTLTYKHKARGR